MEHLNKYINTFMEIRDKYSNKYTIFISIDNSLSSDIEPVLKNGFYAIHKNVQNTWNYFN